MEHLIYGFGERIQLSVYLCDLPDRQFTKMRHEVQRIINPEVDSVIIVDLGTTSNPRNFVSLGREIQLMSFYTRIT